jgi:DNA-binding response OmpR family regulator
MGARKGESRRKATGDARAVPSPPPNSKPTLPPRRHRRDDVPSRRPTILVVEDDPSTGEGLRRALEGEGYQVEWVRDGASALASAARSQSDLVVLDLYLPDVDGIDVCQELRQTYPSLLILVLTARTDEIDVVVGLDAGADDYMVKPFRLAELLARLRAQLRRARPAVDGALVVVGDLRIDPAAHRVFAGAGVEIGLRPKEFDLLMLLASEMGRALGRDRIMKEVWGIEPAGSSKTLDMHVSSLRHKLADGGSTAHIVTVRGSGYRLDP